MFKKIVLGLLLAIILPVIVFANSKFIEGKQYKAVAITPTSIARIEIPKGKVSVVEFFSYGCPWCFHLEPYLEKWLKTKPNYVEFSRVPVLFESGWKVYAKAYYTAKALGVLGKMTPAIFDAIHVKGKNLASENAMRDFFKQHGVSETDFNSVYNFSPGIGMEINHGQKLMLAYKVFAVPTIIVDGKYYTNAQLTNGNDQELMAVVNYLVKKTQNEEKVK